MMGRTLRVSGEGRYRGPERRAYVRQPEPWLPGWLVRALWHVRAGRTPTGGRWVGFGFSWGRRPGKEK